MKEGRVKGLFFLNKVLGKVQKTIYAHKWPRKSKVNNKKTCLPSILSGVFISAALQPMVSRKHTNLRERHTKISSGNFEFFGCFRAIDINPDLSVNFPDSEIWSAPL